MARSDVEGGNPPTIGDRPDRTFAGNPRVRAIRREDVDTKRKEKIKKEKVQRSKENKTKEEKQTTRKHVHRPDRPVVFKTFLNASTRLSFGKRS